MCEVEFFGRCCVRGRYFRLFLMWVDRPLVHHQIVDLEDVANLLMYRKRLGIKKNELTTHEQAR